MTEKHKAKLLELLNERLIAVGTYMFQTIGFPLEAYVDRVNEMSLGVQVVWVNEFIKRHKLQLKPIFYKDLLQ